jgi:hypothetical protein
MASISIFDNIYHIIVDIDNDKHNETLKKSVEKELSNLSTETDNKSLHQLIENCLRNNFQKREDLKNIFLFLLDDVYSLGLDSIFLDHYKNAKNIDAFYNCIINPCFS